MQQKKKIIVLDTTLREGEQSAGICFSLHEKIEIAKYLQEFGVDIIEIGHPGISKVEEEICKSICESVKNIDILVHARACSEDIIAAKNTNASWVGIWASYNDVSIATKFNNKSREWISQQVKDSIKLAKEFNLKVRFTIEDASRTTLKQIHELVETAVNAGANRISLADTVGAWHPNECYKIVKYIVSNFLCEVEVHLHNDLGLAHANAIAAIEAGATIIDASVLGVGERAGICDLFTICLSLEKFYASKYNFKKSQELSNLISRVGAFIIEPHRAIVGKNVFTHVSKYHIKAVKKEASAYEFLTPDDFGVQSKHNLNSLERGSEKRFLNSLQVKKPFIKGSSELKYHRDGVGNRWVFMDNRIDERSSIYIIERIFDKDYSDEYQSHVDAHTHYCDSCFVFMGVNDDGTGLQVSVTLGSDDNEYTQIVESPASIFIPANVKHSYAYLKGTGRFLNFVMARSYNESLS